MSHAWRMPNVRWKTIWRISFDAPRGIAVRQGLRFLRAELPGILAARSDALSPRMLRLVEDLATDWRCAH
jgi:hypothetical protein